MRLLAAEYFLSGPVGIVSTANKRNLGGAPVRFARSIRRSRWPHAGQRILPKSKWPLPALVRTPQSHVMLALLRCLVPGFDGALFSLEWKDALWVKFCMGAPA